MMALSLATSQWNWWYVIRISEVTTKLAKPEIEACEVMHLSHEGWGATAVFKGKQKGCFLHSQFPMDLTVRYSIRFRFVHRKSMEAYGIRFLLFPEVVIRFKYK